MMVQTEWLSTDAAGWEIDLVFAPSNTAKQTVRRSRKRKEKALKPSGFKAFSVAEDKSSATDSIARMDEIKSIHRRRGFLPPAGWI